MGAAYLKGPANVAKPPRGAPGCGGKERHETRGIADKIAAKRVNGRQITGTVRPYYCDVCQGWHLTSYAYQRDRDRRDTPDAAFVSGLVRRY